MKSTSQNEVFSVCGGKTVEFLGVMFVVPLFLIFHVAKVYLKAKSSPCPLLCCDEVL